MAYTRGTEYASSMRPEYRTGRFYTERAKEDTAEGREYWFDGRDLGLYSDLPYGQDRSESSARRSIRTVRFSP